ncbi:uncharacterized protein N7479_011028 [Penicillium vulpinum]|uniref:Vacuolar calcium ion transporter n=1 Tax=Penicillium vulpinum TaxID=29845 RepID=A0A1V6RST3_9EURO|nr:uncharacterized protein N7479_011028 [Penicillium vulpinum]KAJ5952615.1 hypothetical protein N7479_011028 [Penicillium vulpinum]OQE04847.1 hypothetical protein PENVUL_c029G00469 [Penicillium vulpinum]
MSPGRDSPMLNYNSIMTQVQQHLGLLSLLIPLIGITTGALKLNSTAIFTINTVALIPLGSWINRSVDALSVGGSRAVNEVLKSTLGNSVELMIGINAIAQNRLHISQSVILGSVLSNLLLVLGSTIFVSGYDQKRLRFDRTLTTVLSSLMMVVFILLALPTIMDVFPSAKATPEDQILVTQRVTAIILVILLLTFLIFRLGTHAAMFASTPFSQRDQARNGNQSRQNHIVEAQIPQPYIGKGPAAIILAAASTSALACAYYIVSSLKGVASITGMNQSFLAVTLVPLLGNSVKYRSIVVGSRTFNQIELGIRAVINNVLRITMLIAPLLVLVGWAFERPLILRFDGFEATTLLLSVVVMTYLISDGRSNYFEGLMLIGTYIIITFSFFVRPEVPVNVIFLGV